MRNALVFIASVVICDYSLSMNEGALSFESAFTAAGDKINEMINQLRARLFDQRLLLLFTRALCGFDYRTPDNVDREIYSNTIISTMSGRGIRTHGATQANWQEANLRLSRCIGLISAGGLLQNAVTIETEIREIIENQLRPDQLDEQTRRIGATLGKALETVQSYINGNDEPPDDDCPGFSPATDASAPAGNSGSSANEDSVPPPPSRSSARRSPPLPVSPPQAAPPAPAPVAEANCSTFDGLIAYIKDKISTAQKSNGGKRNFDVVFLFRENYKDTLIQRLNAVTGKKDKKAKALVDLVNEMLAKPGDKPNKFVNDIVAKLDLCLKSNGFHRVKAPTPEKPSVLNLDPFGAEY